VAACIGIKAACLASDGNKMAACRLAEAMNDQGTCDTNCEDPSVPKGMLIGEAFAIASGPLFTGSRKGALDLILDAMDGFKDDLKDVSDKISKTVWEKGFTNLAQVFPEADKMFMSGRKKSFSQLIIFSDGKPSFKFSTMNEAKKLKDKNVNVFFININAGPKKEDVDFIKKEVVSQPWNVNYLQIPGVGKLSRELLKWARLAVVQTCPKALSPTKMAATEEAQGFKLVKEGMQCGQTKGSEIDKDPLHLFLGVVASPMDCMVAASALEVQYFTFGTETGPKPNNAGKCYAEMTKDGAACAEGWVDGPTDYYEVLPIEDVGGDTK